MRLNQIRDLIAVSEAGSLRAAARRIGISQPAMSKSLAELEREFQAQLLTRTSRGVALTAAGRAFVARARVVQGELRKVEEDLAALRGGTEGTVAFGIGPALGLPLIPGAMARFRAERPQARVRIREGMRNALLPLVRDETLDFAVSNSLKPPSPGFISGHSSDWNSPLRHARDIRWRARRRCPTSLRRRGCSSIRRGPAVPSSELSARPACHRPMGWCIANPISPPWR